MERQRSTSTSLDGPPVPNLIHIKALRLPGRYSRPMQAALPLAPAGLSAEGPDPRAPATHWSLLDDPAEWTTFGHALDADPASGRWESQVVVEGMHCAACAFTVEAALGGVAGVLKAEVNAATRRARVVWSAAAVRPSRWFEASAAAGYRLLPAGDVSAGMQRRREARLALWRWLVAGFCMMQVMMYAYPAYIAEPGDIAPDALQLLRWASWVLTLPVMLFSCGPFFRSALRDLRQRRIGMDLPVALGIAIAFAASTAATFDPAGALGHEVYFDSLTMFVFFLLTGRWLETRLRGRTAGALEALMNRLPDSIERLGADATFTRVAVRRLVPGDVVRVLPGETFPADGQVVAGETSADEALLTGESRPVPRGLGERVLAGSYNLAAAVQVRIESVGPGTRFAQIVALMESASLHKPRLAQLADRVARPFLAAVLLAAALAAALWWPVDSGRALMVAVAVLIATCPCALSLATPAAMLASAGALARGGTLVRNLQALEALAGVDTVVFDKTGTLTRETPRLERTHGRPDVNADAALALAAALGAQSLHPAARAMVKAWNERHPAPPGWEVSGLVERAGEGVEGTLRPQGATPAGAPRRLRLGSASFCGAASGPAAHEAQVHLADERGWVASFVLAEDLREDARAAVAALQAQGLTVRLLSGDRDAAAREVAARAGISQAQGGCTPEDKLRVLQQLQAQGRRVAMVGDGLNDGPVLAHAHASFAFGQAVPLAQARSDFIVMGDALTAIPGAVAQARRALRVVRQNLWWAAGYNLVGVPFAFVGWLPPWLAGLGMAASSVVVVLNAARLGVVPGRER